MNTITIELCAEDRHALDTLWNAIDKLQKTMERLTAPVNAAAETTVPTAVTEEQLPEQQAIPEVVEPEAPEETPEPEAAPEPQPEELKIGKSEVQKLVVSLSGAGKKDQVRSIVQAYGNTKVSDIPADKLVEVWQKLTALGG